MILVANIGALRSEELVPTLVERLDVRKNLSLSRAVIEALRHIGSMEAVPSLIDILGVRDDEVRREVVFTLETLTGVSLGEKASEWRIWWKEREQERNSQ